MVSFCAGCARESRTVVTEDLVRLSELLGHSSPAITRKYIGLTQKVMMDTYDMLS